MDDKKLIANIILCLILACVGINAHAAADELKRLGKAYPKTIKGVTASYILWQDGSRMPVHGSFGLFNWLTRLIYHVDPTAEGISKDDIRHDRYEPFFRKMYGNSPAEVKKHLVTVYWMPHVFGKRYPLKVTTVNDVDKKLKRISAELEKLPPTYYKYLANPAGSYYWRNVAGESYLSSHSFGIAMDINSSYSNYWLWDFLKLKRPISDLVHHRVTYHNRVPMKIVEIFEKEGFLWGGRWYFYDTMHFEYRPELFV